MILLLCYRARNHGNPTTGLIDDQDRTSSRIEVSPGSLIKTWSPPAALASMIAHVDAVIAVFYNWLNWSNLACTLLFGYTSRFDLLRLTISVPRAIS